jgi:hypothetical protein
MSKSTRDKTRTELEIELDNTRRDLLTSLTSLQRIATSSELFIATYRGSITRAQQKVIEEILELATTNTITRKA